MNIQYVEKLLYSPLEHAMGTFFVVLHCGVMGTVYQLLWPNGCVDSDWDYMLLQSKNIAYANIIYCTTV